MSTSLAANGAGGQGLSAFVFSGGGSLGAVQIGMLRALFEADVCPDFLIGTSVGAVNAAWVAGHPDPDGVMELGDIWMGLRRHDVFPISPITGARGLIGRSNHFISNVNLRTVLERLVEQKLDAEVAANRDVANIHVLPALDLADVSPADFSHTKELIDWGYRAARRYLGSALNGRGVVPEKAKRTLRLDPARAA